MLSPDVITILTYRVCTSYGVDAPLLWRYHTLAHIQARTLILCMATAAGFSQADLRRYFHRPLRPKLCRTAAISHRHWMECDPAYQRCFMETEDHMTCLA